MNGHAAIVALLLAKPGVDPLALWVSVGLFTRGRVVLLCTPTFG